MPGYSGFFAKIHGRVQGVGFRYAAQKQALRLGLTGWVRNDYDGTVEVMCEGEPLKLEQFYLWLKKGPPGSNVVQVERRTITPQKTFRTFTIEF
ncbi:MAG: acylphosphatase [Spirochaetota bacterium]